ncbi:hypothetical protein DSO57_1030720 [Entomophthora muscae]|uniref:Uncharacterized protein n=1 Tax=Entomophthora muscae TaxID=34485 RepID=A0ACC2UKQ3_9FUNG|nr:hypothetical protein DSO57_1030720 [Entomophthora muscae]
MSLLKNEYSTIAEIKKLIPPMLKSFHKGQNGRVAVIGGSLEYTGAPYFSAMSSLRAGADLAHVICEPSAAAVIKTYSPDLIVHPLLRTEGCKEFSSQEIVSKIDELLPRFHSLIIGPGLSRDPLILSTTLLVIQNAKAKKIPMVIDAVRYLTFIITELLRMAFFDAKKSRHFSKTTKRLF